MTKQNLVDQTWVYNYKKVHSTTAEEQLLYVFLTKSEFR